MNGDYSKQMTSRSALHKAPLRKSRAQLSATKKRGGQSRRTSAVVAASAKRWEDRFLAALSRTLNVTASAREAGVGRRTVYEARDADPEFATAWLEALYTAIETAEGELYRRAVAGVDEPVFQGGKLVGALKRYSDVLLIFLLKAHRPTVYRETLKVLNWRDDVIALLRSGKLTPEAVKAELGDELAGELIVAADVVRGKG